MSGLKTMLVAVNAKYVHTNIAVRYISRLCKEYNIDCEFSEFTINEPLDNVLRKLYAADCDAYGFSCYIWNIEYILKLAKLLKKIRPERKIFLGGPEVSYSADELIKKDFIDFIVSGEGEYAVKKLIESSFSEKPIIYGEKPESLDELPFPYSLDDLKEAVKNEKLVYYETSRGCPFNCSYCLSSVESGVRFMPLDRVKKELLLFASSGVKTVKFVDRTFNADKKRAFEIWKYCMTIEGETCFHFEIGADLLTDEQIDLLKNAPLGKFQFEIGVQTTNPDTIKEISRTMDIERLSKNVRRLKEETNVLLHLDLIAGLPYEDLEVFKKSFNDVYGLSPDVLQLGFLKLLKGSEMRNRADEYGMCFSDFAPYEVFSTSWLSFSDLSRLKAVEDVFERYYNSARFTRTLPKALERFSSPFDFYEKLSLYWQKNGLLGQGVKRISLYSHLYEFLKSVLKEEDLAPIMELMKKDFTDWHSKGEGTPEWYKKY